MTYCTTYIRHGAGRSLNARTAEDEGKLPLSRAIRPVAEALGITRAQARDLLEYVGACEWHHVGKYANECNYYDVEDVVASFASDEALLAMAAAGEAERAAADTRGALRVEQVRSIGCTPSEAVYEEIQRLAAALAFVPEKPSHLSEHGRSIERVERLLGSAAWTLMQNIEWRLKA
jgi:hypothetical protein